MLASETSHPFREPSQPQRPRPAIQPAKKKEPESRNSHRESSSSNSASTAGPMYTKAITWPPCTAHR
jgi:hypothetical protein